MKGGAFVYRHRKRIFFDLIPTNEMSRWYGGPIFNYTYLQSQVLKSDFIFAEFSISEVTKEEDLYLIFDDDTQKIRLRNLYNAHFHKARIPTAYRADLLAYIKDFEKKNDSIIHFVKKRLKAESQGAQK